MKKIVCYAVVILFVLSCFIACSALAFLIAVLILRAMEAISIPHAPLVLMMVLVYLWLMRSLSRLRRK